MGPSLCRAAAAGARRLRRLRRLCAAGGLARRSLEPLPDDGAVLLRRRRRAVPHRVRPLALADRPPPRAHRDVRRDLSPRRHRPARRGAGAAGERLQALTQTNLGIGALVAFVYTLAAFAQLAMGSLIDRFELRRLMIGIALIQIPLLALAANLQGWAMLAGALLMMLAVFGQIPLNDAIVGRYCADRKS